jgi:molecular chaperone HscA
MGKSYKDVSQSAGYFTYKVIDDNTDAHVKVQVGSSFYSPTDLSSFILAELKKRAEHILKTPVTKAVITVPAYFNDAQRQATRDAGKLAGLDVLRIVNEPTAASLAYGLGLDKEGETTIAVYDLGGGTFDISILKITDGVFDVLSTNGDTYLGGDDIDRAIIDYWLAQKSIDIKVLQTNPNLLQTIRLSAEEAKKALSSSDQFETTIDGQVYQITKSVFEDLITTIIGKTIDCCKNALADAKLNAGQIDSIVMVGGSTRIPAVKAAVASFFGKPVNDSINPDEVVALGAAVQADILAGNNKDFLLLDITPLSLGIETMGGLMEVLVPRNSKVPTQVGRQYTTHVDGQSSMRISVYQGERDLVKDNRKLAEFNLSGIPGMPAGLPKVDIQFLLNADGILVVKAKELRSCVEQIIEVKPALDLTDDQVEKMLQDSIENAAADMVLRALVEARTEGEQLLAVTEKFMVKHQSLLTPEEVTQTALALQALQLAITMEDKNLIQTKIEALNETTRPFAERAMDEAVKGALKGKSI